MFQKKKARPMIGLAVLFVGLLLAACTIDIVKLFVSTDTPGTVDGVDFGPEDILLWEASSGEWSLFFDGSEHGLQQGKHDLEAISIWLSGTTDIYISFYQNKVMVPGLGQVRGQEVIKFTGAGGYERYFDGSDVGLTTVSEKIDGLEVTPDDGNQFPDCLSLITISTLGEYSIPAKFTNGAGKLTGDGSDALLFCASSLGDETAGVWFTSFDGSTESVPKNYLDSLTLPLLEEVTPYFTTPGAFAMDAAFGGHSEVYGMTGSATFFGPVFSAPDEGLTEYVDALSIPLCPLTC